MWGNMGKGGTVGTLRGGLGGGKVKTLGNMWGNGGKGGERETAKKVVAVGFLSGVGNDGGKHGKWDMEDGQTWETRK
jgi:hypothetical protein